MKHKAIASKRLGSHLVQVIRLSSWAVRKVSKIDSNSPFPNQTPMRGTEVTMGESATLASIRLHRLESGQGNPGCQPVSGS